MKVPTATYRLQFNYAFTFSDARKIVDYLADLGVSDIYASPIFKARKGSTHGYDIVDPNQLNPELGSRAEFEGLIKDVQQRGMNWIQDIVPNHMAFDSRNKMLMSVLEDGPNSEFYDFFDIDWELDETLKGRLLAPFLGKLYSEALEDGEITLRYDQDGFSINYYDLKLPVKIESYWNIITLRFEKLRDMLGENNPDFIKFLGILYSVKNLPSSRSESVQRCHQVKFIKRMLWEFYEKSPVVNAFIKEKIDLFNGKKGDPESFNLLDNLLSEQHFRLAFWKVATEEINYRRFFNINGLISLRMEDRKVFDATHELTFELVRDKRVTGLRVDHIDGLADPANYLRRLREKTGEIYIVVEKILGRQEELPDWPVQGTTGYDFLNYLNGIFCSPESASAFNKIYSGFTGLRFSYADLLFNKKMLVLGKDMAGDIDILAYMMKRIAGGLRHGNDMTLYGIRRALLDILALFPVYRTYVTREDFREQDKIYITDTIAKARLKNPGLVHEFRFIEKVLCLQFEPYLTQENKNEWIEFTMRFQQLTGPLMAKGFEDTILYVYDRLISLNEVGSDPLIFGTTDYEFHSFNVHRAYVWPAAMSASATHDSKRGEDVRARINVLSEMPENWKRNLLKWSRINNKYKRVVNTLNVPDKNDEYFLYQTLIGIWPFYESQYEDCIERVKNYIVKAVREAKVYTAWLKPDTDYEEAFKTFISDICAKDGEFLEEFLPFQREIAYYGLFNSLSQILIKVTAPGVPDFYRGTEFWDFNLVDPDNRRPVDFAARRKCLDELKRKRENGTILLIDDLLRQKENGHIKLFLIKSVLAARTQRKALFERGSYIPLHTGGKLRNNIFAFARNLWLEEKGLEWCVSVVPRFLTQVVGQEHYPLGREVWADTYVETPSGAPLFWHNAITDQLVEGENRLYIADILANFPVGLLFDKEER